MSIFEEVKRSVTTRQAAERYGVRVCLLYTSDAADD